MDEQIQSLIEQGMSGLIELVPDYEPEHSIKGIHIELIERDNQWKVTIQFEDLTWFKYAAYIDIESEDLEFDGIN